MDNSIQYTEIEPKIKLARHVVCTDPNRITVLRYHTHGCYEIVLRIRDRDYLFEIVLDKPFWPPVAPASPKEETAVNKCIDCEAIINSSWARCDDCTADNRHVGETELSKGGWRSGGVVKFPVGPASKGE